MNGNIIGALITGLLLSGATAFGYVVSKNGLGLPPSLAAPVSIRQGSVASGTSGTHSALYFGTSRSRSLGRSHMGGGFSGGK